MLQLIDAYQRDCRGTPAFDDRDAVERSLEALYARARHAYPEFEVGAIAFAAHLGHCGAPVEQFPVTDVHAEDLFLCCAALLGLEGAVRTLRSKHRAVMVSALQTIDTSPEFVEEIEQRLWGSVLVSAAATPPKLASYSGKGPLTAWLGVAAQRLALMIRRNEAAHRRATCKVAMEARLASADPELTLIKNHLREPFQRAITEAFDTLDDRQRMLYSLHVIDGLTFDRIGSMYSVSHSTVSRWMAGARRSILTEAQRLLREQMRLTVEEFDSLARLLASEIDVSVSLIRGNAG